MNNKGFTIIELLTAFTLSTIVMIFIFNVVFILKDLYVVNGAKSTLMVEQSLMSQEINKDFSNLNIDTIKSCTTGDLCLEIGYKDLAGTIQTKKLVVNKTTKKIQYDNYIYPLESTEDFNFEGLASKYAFDKDLKVCYKTASTNATTKNSYLYINIPIHSSKIEDVNFGIKVMYLYNNNSLSLSGISSC